MLRILQPPARLVACPSSLCQAPQLGGVCRLQLVPVLDDDALVWIDGELRPVGEASVSVLDHGLVVGDGAFETLLIVNHTGNSEPSLCRFHISPRQLPASPSVRHMSR